jgi:23S rRNA (guanosine2251-2'-O)-methyltransferase
MNQRGGKSRDLIYGVHPVLEALRAETPLEKIWLRKGTRADWLKELRDRAADQGVAILYVPEQAFIRLAQDANHQGLVAQLSAITYQPLEEILIRIGESGRDPLIVMLDGVTDVRNFGAIVRTAECMGADAVIVPVAGSAAASAEAVKASAGALLHLPVCRERNLVDALLMLQSYGLRVVALTEKAESDIFDTDLSGPLCLIFGDESKGISSTLIRRADTGVHIPMAGKIDSLNVSVAVGMALAESVRQRKTAAI